MVQVFPNSRNVIPGSVKFSDRPAQRERRAVRRDGRRDPRRSPRSSRAESGLPITIEQVSYLPGAARSTPTASTRSRARREKLGYSNMDAVSGAGHDAVYMARLAPAGMIFIPCKDGISHNEIEDAKPEHIDGGLQRAAARDAGARRRGPRNCCK